MKIYTVTDSEFSGFGRLFKDHDISVLPKNHKNLHADLIIFTGGESDIHPSFYGKKAPANGCFDTTRDEYELSVFKEIQDGLLTEKVLGICRGMQMLAVGFGGTLYYDIKKEVGMPHNSTHRLEWRMSNTLIPCFPVVNSVHHQGVKQCRDSSGYKLLAYEPNTGVPEVAVWGNKYIGLQFHPEWMLGVEGIDKFLEILENWVVNDVPVMESLKRPTRPSYIDSTLNEYLKSSTNKSNW